MSQPVIRVEGLGKEYVIGGRESGRETFREMLTSSFAAPFRRLRRLKGDVAPEERIWALKDVSFEVSEGEVVGIIGGNGAGKSTLLKVLSRITEPTEGRVQIRGRVASLLEVGTGFHGELTGRENIYLNGAILGMSRGEIDRKFDEIVDFAGIEKFLDTPVKRYSSGMYVRLAFSVAAHLDADILLVDEVLAVGDNSFQKKCLNKIDETRTSGRTILFVSHNMDMIRKICTRAVYIKNGHVQSSDGVTNTITAYLGERKAKSHDHIIEFESSPRSAFHVKRIELFDAKGQPLSSVSTWDEVVFRIVFFAPWDFNGGAVVLHISTLSGTVISHFSTQPESNFVIDFKRGINAVDCYLPRLLLSAGRYLIGAGLSVPNVEWLYKNLDGGVLEVMERDVFDSALPPHENRYYIPMEHEWRCVSS